MVSEHEERLDVPTGCIRPAGKRRLPDGYDVAKFVKSSGVGYVPGMYDDVDAPSGHVGKRLAERDSRGGIGCHMRIADYADLDNRRSPLRRPCP